MKRKIYFLLVALTVSMFGFAQRPQPAAARRAASTAPVIHKAPQSMAGTTLNLANYSDISDWTVNNATQGTVSSNKYPYNTTKSLAGEAYINSNPNIVFSYTNTADKTNAFNIYTGQCYESGAKNALIRIMNTAAGEHIKIHVAAKGTTAAKFDITVNAIAISSDVTLPAKDKTKAGTDDYDAYGYCWKELEFLSLGGTVELKETAGGFRVDKIEVTAATTATILNVGEAISIGTKLTPGTSTDVEYSVEGYVVNAESYSPVFSDQTWWMSRSESNSHGDMFKAYQCYATQSGERVQLLNGDWIRLTGKLTYYYESATDTYYTEIVRGTAELLTAASGRHFVPGTTVNVATALQYGSALTAGRRTPLNHTIMGYVSALVGNTTDYSNYGNQTFWISDDPTSTASTNADGAFEVYRGIPNQEVKVGDFVIVESPIYRYNTSTIETETAVPVKVVTPITIDFGEKFICSYHDDFGDNWELASHTSTDGYLVSIDVLNDSKTSPAGFYSSSVGQYLTDYTYIKKDGSVITYKEVTATITDDGKGNNVAAQIHFLTNDDKVYIVSMKQKPTTIDVTLNGDIIQYSDDDLAWITYGYYSGSYYKFVIPTTADKVSPIGTFTTFSPASGIYASDNSTQFISFVSGSVEIKKVGTDEFSYEIKATVVGDDSKTYNIVMTIPLYTVDVEFFPPSGVPAAGIEVLGTFSHWGDGAVKMTYDDKSGAYIATLTNIQYEDWFKFREAGTWEHEIQVYNTSTEKWVNCESVYFPGNWSTVSGSYHMKVSVDYTNASQYRWTVETAKPTGLEATVNLADHNAILSWDADATVTYYNVATYYGEYQLASYYTEPGYAIDGKCSVTLEQLVDNGNYSFIVYAYDDDDQMLGQTKKEFVVSGGTALGMSKFSVLIPEDCCFDRSNVWFCITPAGGTSQWYEVTGVNGWYSQSFDVPAFSYIIQIASQKVTGSWEGVPRTYQYTINQNDVYYRMHKYYYETGDYWNLFTADGSEQDHNYAPKSVNVSVDDANAQFTLTATYEQRSQELQFRLRDKGTGNYYNYYIYPGSDELTSASRTFPSKYETATTFDQIIVYASDDNYNYVCSHLEENIEFTVPASPYTPTGLEAKVNADKTVTLSWDARTDVSEYYVAVYYKGSSFWGKDIEVSSTSPVDGKYSVLFDTPLDNGEYLFKVTVYDSEGKNAGSASKTFTLDGISALGDVTVRVLIPSGIDFDVTNGVWFYWWEAGTAGDWAKATDKGGRWYEATFNVSSAAYKCRVQNTDNWSGTYQQSYESAYITEKSQCLKVNGYYDLLKADCSEVDYDYTITDIQIDNSVIGKLTFSVTAKDYAPYYAVYYRLHGSGDSYLWLGSGELDASHSFTFSKDLGNTTDLLFDYYIYPVDENWNRAGTNYEGTLTIPANPFYPANLSATAIGGNTYELSWDVAAGVTKYRVYCEDAAGHEIIDQYFKPEDLPTSGGKYVVTVSGFTSDGTAKWIVYTYDAAGYNRAYANSTFDVVLTDLGSVTVRIQIPTDNNMDISKGVWFAWKLESESDYHVVATTEKSNRWFEASFTVNDTHYQIATLNDDNVSASQASYVITSYEAYACFSQLYNSGNKYWSLYKSDCNAPDHDYRITNLTTKAEVGGKVQITIEAKDYADGYEVYARPKGSSDDYDYVGYFEYDGKTAPSETITFNATEDGTYDLKVHIYREIDGYWRLVAEDYYGTTEVKKNPNIPQNPKAVVGADKVTVTFTWEIDKDSKADHYAIRVVDVATDWTRGELLDIKGNTATMQLLVPSEYSWEIDAYDADDNWLGYTTAGNHFKTEGADLTPTKLEVKEIKDLTVTLTWEADPSVTECTYYVDGPMYTGYLKATSTNGKFSATFTAPMGNDGSYSWGVVASKEGESYFISNWADGTSFTLTEPTTPPAHTYTLSINSPDGGYIYSPYGTFAEGAEITMCAYSYTYYQFVEWSDGCKDQTRVLTITQDTLLTAYFVSTKYFYDLVVTASEGGKVNNVSGNYPEYARVELIATPNTGYKFKQWSDGVKDATRTLVIWQDSTLIASFEPDGSTPPGPTPEPAKYSFQYSYTGLGKVTSSVAEGTYDEGTAITLEATPEKDWTFAGWSNGSKKAKLTIVLSQDTNLVASFVTTKKYKVTIKAGSNGKVDPALNEAEYTGGSVIDIKAIPNDEYKFIKWSDGNTDAERSIVITQDTSLTASFEEIVYFTLTVEIEPNENAGTVLFDGKENSSMRKRVEEGKTIVLSAEPSKGYAFSHYEDGASEITNAEYSVVMNKKRTVTAVFKKAQGLDDVTGSSATVSQKMLINGTIYILRGDKIYTLDGQAVK